MFDVVRRSAATGPWRPFGIFWRRSKKFGWIVRLQLLHGEQWANRRAAKLGVWHRPSQAEIAWLSDIASVPPELRRTLSGDGPTAGRR
jgi:hypothetical protein